MVKLLGTIAFFYLLWTQSPNFLNQQHLWTGSLATLIAVTFYLAKTVHYAPALAFFSSGLSAIYCFLNPISPYAKVMNPNQITGIDALTAGAFSFLLLLTLFTLLISSETTTKLFKAYAWISILNAVGMILNFVLIKSAVGIFNCTSIDAFFVVICLPIAIRFYGKWAGVPIALAIFLSRSSTGIGAIVLFFLIRYIRRGVFRVQYLLIPLAIIGVGLWYVGQKELLDPGASGRVILWQKSLELWSAHLNQWIGSGTGSYWLFGMTASQSTATPATWAHSEWVQVLFEQGHLGLVSMIILSVTMLIRTRKNEPLFLSIALYMFCAALQMPFRLFLTSLLGMLLIKTSFKKNNVVDF